MIEETIRNQEPENKPISWEEMYKNAEKRIYQLEKDVRTSEAYQDQLQERINDLCKVIASLTKGYL